MASVSDIARLAGVAKSTVSLVLNGKPGVSQRMRDRVRKVAADLDSHDPDDRDTTRGNPGILLIHPMSMSSQQVFKELLQGVRAAVVDEAHGNLGLAVHDPPLKPDHATSVLIHDPQLRPDAVIVMASSRDDPLLPELLAEGLPCVLLARQWAPDGISCVGMDNEEAASMAVRYFLQRGHTHIVFAGGDLTYEYTELRLAGYRTAMERAGLLSRHFLGAGDAAVEAIVAASGSTGEGGMPTAILFVNDEQARTGLLRLAQLGYRVPDQVSAIGFDDSENAILCEPPLTSVRVPRFQIGKLAGRIALDHVGMPNLHSETIVLRTTLSERQSVADLGNGQRVDQGGHPQAS
ncbi:MAG: LacI family DNA-binding transcriptional regulator [Spirochaetales bacterium]|nr:LacI family DNA-binding transcriptional regulator [Spirochaetales bacterium]